MNEHLKPLLALIRKGESRGNYNAIWGGIKKSDYPLKSLTSMTIKEVLDWQDKIDPKYPSEASGAYQVLEDTLRENYASYGLSLSDKFDEANQDKFAIGLLKRQGIANYLAGTITAEKFGQNLSMEWASLPCTINDKHGSEAMGQSYYDGDKLNKANVTIQTLLANIRQVKVLATSATPQPTPQPTPKATQGWLANLIAALFAWLKPKGPKA